LEQGGQGWAYSDALERSRGRTRWLAFIDLDEFLFSPGPTPLPAAARQLLALSELSCSAYPEAMSRSSAGKFG
jgi:hypothetical protein